ncbi:vWA domain-containing protein [Marinibacterium profundimaris]|uniref:VWFA domain-containing protein n=1 Tax=Marinibacterium profundimaris TaxID=1679460 RepID=A0A225NG74_9RHOB|nr:VWA domain-containing protein [Marinibacterium profundimaris]OWU72497.1 hypothetical protein ATO3_15560 [Marinibacterium profundimaris]
MTGIELLRPWWLLALPVLGLLAFWLLHRPASLGAWKAAIDPALMAAMARIGRVPEARASRAALVPLGAAACVVLALSGPAVEVRDAPSFRNLDGVVLVMDLSPSVTGGEALEPLRTAARVLLARLGSRPAALVVYGGDAYLAAPLTSDTTQIGLTVALLDEDIVPDPGSRPAVALARAGALLREAEIVAGDVVLFSDGGGIDGAAHRQAADLAGQGARLWTVSAGAAGDSDTEALSALAETGGGALHDTAQASALADAIAAGRTARLGETDIAMLTLNDLGRWLLLPALLLCALLFRRRA